jgi:hypothetical protein
MADNKSNVVKGGLEFVPLRPGETEEMYRLTPGRRHPGQQLLGFMTKEKVREDGKKR